LTKRQGSFIISIVWRPAELMALKTHIVEKKNSKNNQECYHELMEIRDQVIEMVREMPNPHSPQIKIPFGQKNNHIEPTITTPMGEISETLMSGALGDYYADKREY